MDIRIVLVAGRDAVAGDDRAVHQFGRADHRGQDAFGVHAVDPRVVQQALRLEHVHIGDLGQAGMLVHGLGQRREVVGFHAVGGGVLAGGGQIMGGLEPGNTVAGLALVGLQIFGGVEGQDHVAGPGERRVVRTGAGHVHDAFLRGHHAARGQHGHAAQDERFAFAGVFHIAYPAGEDFARAFQLAAGLDGVLDRHDAHVFTRVGHVDGDGGKPVVLQQQRCQFILVDGQHAAANACLCAEGQLADTDAVQFQFHVTSPCGPEAGRAGTPCRSRSGSKCFRYCRPNSRW